MARLPIPAPPYDGGCLCGAARYRVGAWPLGINACHCGVCKKLSGATGIVTILAARDAFEHEKGDVVRYRRRGDSGREIDLIRCAMCGIRLWHEPLSAPHLVIVSAGTLDDSSWVVPVSHIWVEKAAAGVRFEEGAITVEGQPSSRQILMDAFVKIYGDRPAATGN